MNNKETMTMTATEVILAAAKKSGLLQEVAEALCLADEIANYNGSPVEPYQRAVVEDLTKGFDDHICTAAVAVEHVFGGPVNGGPYTDAQLAPYLGERAS
jgi:hypothetical protein